MKRGFVVEFEFDISVRSFDENDAGRILTKAEGRRQKANGKKRETTL